MRECKKCLLIESAQGDMLGLIQSKIENLPLTEKASESIYNERLSACKSCEKLVSGTCLKCGCYVEFRAAFKNKHCPDKPSKW